MKPSAIIYTCCNPGQVALLWAWQPKPFGHGWIDVKAEPLVRLSEVEALRKDAERYRWLRDGSIAEHIESTDGTPYVGSNGEGSFSYYGERLDDLIDTDMMKARP